MYIPCGIASCLWAPPTTSSSSDDLSPQPTPSTADAASSVPPLGSTCRLQPHLDLPVGVLPHSAFALRHVFRWNGKIYVVFVGEEDEGQPYFGYWKMEHLASGRVVFHVFRLDISATGEALANSFHCRWVQEPNETESCNGSLLGAPVEDEAYKCSTISKWLASYLMPYIYFRPNLSAKFDDIELVLTFLHSDLFILRREKRKQGFLLVELWLKEEMWWAKPLRLVSSGTGKRKTLDSFCLWRMEEEQCFQDCILIVGRFCGMDEGVWWIIKRQHAAIVVVSQGMLPEINDGTRFSLVKHLQLK